MTTPLASDLEHEIGLSGLLAIRLHSSGIRIRGVDGHTVRVHDATGTLDRTVRVERAPGSLSLRVDRGLSIGIGSVAFAAGRRAPDLDIEAPFGTTIVVETASGDVTVDGLTGDQRYRTASGDLVLRDVCGRLTIDAVSGDVDVVVSGAGIVGVRTVSGDLSIRGEQALSSAKLATTSGEVRLEGRFVGPGPYSIETVSGDTVVSPTGGLRVEVKTVTGDVRSEVESTSEGGRGSRTIVVGGGGPSLAIRSISGDIRVVGHAAAQRAIALMAPTPPEPPVPPEPPIPPQAPPARDRAEAIVPDSSMTVLQALERGEIDVAEASRRLAALDSVDDAGSPA